MDAFVKFIKNARWFVISALIVFSFWAVPEINYYFKKLESEKAAEIRRLELIKQDKAAALAKEKEAGLHKPIQTSKTLIPPDRLGFKCETNEFYPILFFVTIKNDDFSQITFIRPIADQETNTFTYEVVNKKNMDRDRKWDDSYFLDSFKIFPKKIEFFDYVIQKNLKQEDMKLVLNRENLELNIDDYFQWMFVRDGESFKSQCSETSFESILDYAKKHNDNLKNKNIL